MIKILYQYHFGNESIDVWKYWCMKVLMYESIDVWQNWCMTVLMYESTDVWKLAIRNTSSGGLVVGGGGGITSSTLAANDTLLFWAVRRSGLHPKTKCWIKGFEKYKFVNNELNCLLYYL